MCPQFLVTIIALLKLSETFVDSSLEEIIQTYANDLKRFKMSLKQLNLECQVPGHFCMQPQDFDL